MTLEMRGICKSFGSNDVLKHVDFSIQGGEICALLGENGAGKSTLMNILGGVLPADRGEIVIDGTPVHFRTPSDSLSAGVAFIHQELSLINDLAIYENMFIGRELKTKYGLLDAKTMIQKTQEVFDRLELHLDPRTMVRELDASYKQIVEISRAMMMEASLIIMDEPTTSLTDPEIERVFDMMRMLQKQNVAIVFISHKLKEVMEVCNRYTVLRDGNMVAAGPVAEVTTADLARFMVGHDVRTENLHQDKELGGEILRGEGLSDGSHFRDISFTVHAGEVLGVTGLLGDGRSELFQAVFGDLPYTGQLFVEGQPVKVTSTPQAIRLGIGYVPRNRKENGIIKDMDIVENGSMVTLPRLARRGLIDQRRRDAEFDRQVSELHIKMGKKTDLITSLSGGLQSVQSAVDAQLIPGSQALEAGLSQLADGSSTLEYGVSKYTGGVSSLTDGLQTLDSNTGTLVGGASSLNSGAQTLADSVPTLTNAVSQLQSGASQLADGTAQLAANNDTLNSGAAQLADGAGQIQDGASQLADGSVELGDGLVQLSNGAVTLQTSIADGADEVNSIDSTDKTYDMFSAPVMTNETYETTVPTNGNAMAAYMMSVGLWVSGLAFCVMLSPYHQKIGNRKAGKAWLLTLAKLWALGLLQAVLMILCLSWINGFQPEYMGKTLIIACLASIAFLTLEYCVNFFLDIIGDFILLVFMVLQLSGCAGTYPLELSDKFYQVLNPFMPFTYTVHGFRSGIASGLDITTDCVVLAVIAVVFAGLLLVGFRKRAKKEQESEVEVAEKAISGTPVQA